MLFSEFKKMCQIAWIDKFNYLCIDMAKDKNDGIYRSFNESKNKNTYIECIPENEVF